MAAYVYVLPHSTEPRVKIGKARDVFLRAWQIGIENFDLDRGWAYKLFNDEEASFIERHIHLECRRFRLKPQDGPGSRRQSGSTEWFSSEAADLIVSQLEEKFAGSGWPRVPIPRTITHQPKRRAPVKEEQPLISGYGLERNGVSVKIAFKKGKAQIKGDLDFEKVWRLIQDNLADLANPPRD